jgi:AraC-like DNA-binding protein
MTRHIHHIELGKFSVPGMRVAVRWFPTGAKDRQIWRASSDILTFSRIVGEPVVRRDSLDVGAVLYRAAPLTFWPRASVWESRETESRILTVSAYFDTGFALVPRMTQPHGICVDDFSILEMMQVLHDEVTMPGMASHDLVEAIGKILRIKLLRITSRRTVDVPAHKCRRSADAAMLNSLIGASSQRIPTTSQMATQLNTSRRGLLRLFKAAIGTSPSHYLDEAKLERAKTFLATSKMTMKQVSYEAGYSTPSHFATKFRQLTGLTPSAFRQQARRAAGLLTCAAAPGNSDAAA